jgi:F-type H+-transporting ATPase subunit alpha
MPVEEQVIVLMAGTRGYLDAIPVGDVRRFEQELLQHFRTRHGDILSGIKTTGAIPDEDALENGIKAFAELFSPTAAAV